MKGTCYDGFHDGNADPEAPIGLGLGRLERVEIPSRTNGDVGKSWDESGEQEVCQYGSGVHGVK